MGLTSPPVRFEIELTAEQAAIIDRIWSEHGKLGRAMMLQPRLVGNSYRALRGRVFSGDETEEIAVVLETFPKGATP